jgi:hypothetical protein
VAPHPNPKPRLQTPAPATAPKQSNSTVKYFKGEFQDPTTFFQVPLLNAVAREAARGALAKASPEGAAGFRWAPRLFAFPHPYLQSKSLLGGVLAAFIFAALMFSFVAQVWGGARRRGPRGAGRGCRGLSRGCRDIGSRQAAAAARVDAATVGSRLAAPPSPASSTHDDTSAHTPPPPPAPPKMSNLVSEREAGLRTALRNMGMLDSSYWASWMAFDAVMALLGATLILVFGARRGAGRAPPGRRGRAGWAAQRAGRAHPAAPAPAGPSEAGRTPRQRLNRHRPRPPRAPPHPPIPQASSCSSPTSSTTTRRCCCCCSGCSAWP